MARTKMLPCTLTRAQILYCTCLAPRCCIAETIPKVRAKMLPRTMSRTRARTNLHRTMARVKLPRTMACTMASAKMLSGTKMLPRTKMLHAAPTR